MKNYRQYDPERNNKSRNRAQKRLKERELNKAFSRMLIRSGGNFLDEEGYLKEKFLEKNHKILDWNKVSKTEKLSKEFLVKFAKKINWTLMIDNPNINFDFDLVEEFAEFVDWITLKEKDKITLEMSLKLGDIIKKRLAVENLYSNANFVSGTSYVYTYAV